MIKLFEGNKGFIVTIPFVGFASEPQNPEDLFQYVSKDELATPKFACTICNKRFPSNTATRNHIESIHFPGIFKYECKMCDKEFISKSAVNYHITMQHNRKL